MTATTQEIEIASEPETGNAKPSPARPALCTHVMATGATCGYPAVNGATLCFHHSAVKTALARVTPVDQVPYGTFSPIPFVFAEDAASLQINYHLLLQAVAEKRVDHPAGTLMFRILRSMADNLKNPLVAKSPATHGSGDQINHTDTAVPYLEETWDQNSASEPTSTVTEEQNPSVPSVVKSEPGPQAKQAPKKKIRPEDEPELKAAIEALPPDTRDNVNQILAQRDYLQDAELQYFSLPPYDKPENKPEPWMPEPLNPSVQRIIALSSERP